MKFNPEIESLLNKFNINRTVGLVTLLCLYHELDDDRVKNTIENQQKITLTKIVERDYANGGIKWNIPLYEGEQVIDKNWGWVDEYRELFARYRPDAKGTKSVVLKKMQKFFSEHPEVRKEEIFQATEMYLRTFAASTPNQRKYIQQADYFISKATEGVKTSRLEQYLELIKDSHKNDDSIAQRNLGQIIEAVENYMEEQK